MAPWRGSLLAAACALALYLPFSSIQFDPNGINDAAAVEDGGAALVQPNHMLYRPLGFALVAATRWLGYQGRAVGVLQIVTAVCAALAVGAALRIYLAIGANRWAAALAAALLAVSWAQWRFSTDAHYIATATLPTAVAVAWLCAGSGSVASAVGIGLCYAVAVLAWEANVSLAPALLAGLWWHPRASRPRAAAAAFALSGAGSTVLGAGLAGALAGRVHGIRELSAWALSYSSPEQALPTWGVWAPERLLSAVPTWAASVIPVWAGLGLRAALRGTPDPGKLLAQLALVALLALVIFSLARGIACVRADRTRRWTVLWMIGAFTLYLPFIVWWEPDAPMWFVIPNLFLAGAGAVVWSAAARRGERLLLAAAVVVIAAANFTYTIWPDHVTPNPRIARARCITEHASASDVLVVTDWEWHDYARYFFGYQGQLLSLIDRRSRASKLDDITAAIAAAHRRGGHAYAVATQAYDPARAQWLTVQTGLAASDLDRFDPRPAFACNDVALVELLGGASP